jgi:hypothetical protein
VAGPANTQITGAKPHARIDDGGGGLDKGAGRAEHYACLADGRVHRELGGNVKIPDHDAVPLPTTPHTHHETKHPSSPHNITSEPPHTWSSEVLTKKSLVHGRPVAALTLRETSLMRVASRPTIAHLSGSRAAVRVRYSAISLRTWLVTATWMVCALTRESREWNRCHKTTTITHLPVKPVQPHNTTSNGRSA